MPKKIKAKDLAEIIFDWMEAGREEREDYLKEGTEILLEGKFDPRHHMFTTMAKFMFKNGYSLEAVTEVVDLPLAELKEIEGSIKAIH